MARTENPVENTDEKQLTDMPGGFPGNQNALDRVAGVGAESRGRLQCDGRHDPLAIQPEFSASVQPSVPVYVRAHKSEGLTWEHRAHLLAALER